MSISGVIDMGVNSNKQILSFVSSVIMNKIIFQTHFHSKDTLSDLNIHIEKTGNLLSISRFVLPIVFLRFLPDYNT